MQRRKAEQDRKKREQDQMLNWLDSEKRRKEEEERVQKIEYAQKCKVALENLDNARAQAEKKKQAERQADIKCAQDAIKAMDKAEGDNKAAVKARMDQIEKNC